MSILGFLSAKLDREQSLLEQLNEALLVVQSDCLGRASELGFSPENIQAAKQTLRDFIKRLRETLQDHRDNAELSALVSRIREGNFELDEWLNDLAELESQLGERTSLPAEAIPMLEWVLTLLDQELTAEFNRLYSR